MGYKQRIEMAGVRYGRLVGVALSHRSASGHAHWVFRCDCGDEVVSNGANVRSGNTTSCGCVHREISAARLLVHGHRAAKRHDATYRAWQAMNDGCSNPSSPGFTRCGAVGVGVCPEWRVDFQQFLADMGERPAATVLDRRDGGRGFEPANCSWEPRRSRAERAAQGWAAARRTASAYTPAFLSVEGS